MNFIRSLNISKGLLYFLMSLALVAVPVSFQMGSKKADLVTEFKDIKKEIQITNNKIDSLNKKMLILDKSVLQSKQANAAAINTMVSKVEDQMIFLIDFKDENTDLIKRALKIQSEAIRERVEDDLLKPNPNIVARPVNNKNNYNIIAEKDTSNLK